MKQITWSQIFFGIFAGSIFAAKGLGLYDGQGIFKLVLILAGVCWAGKVVLTDYSKEISLSVFLHWEQDLFLIKFQEIKVCYFISCF